MMIGHCDGKKTDRSKYLHLEVNVRSEEVPREGFERASGMVQPSDKALIITVEAVLAGDGVNVVVHSEVI
jgi:hypothetical protein